MKPLLKEAEEQLKIYISMKSHIKETSFKLEFNKLKAS